MIKIFTIYKQGQTIPYKVLKGIASQTVECCLVPISQDKGKTPRLNSVNNWIRALEYSTDEIFIGMDGDVVLDDPNTIQTLLGSMNSDIFMATIRTQIVHVKCSTTQLKLAHALFACSEPKILLKELVDIKKDWTGNCSMCRAINALIQKDKKIKLIAFPMGYECCRETLIRKEKK